MTVETAYTVMMIHGRLRCVQGWGGSVVSGQVRPCEVWQTEERGHVLPWNSAAQTPQMQR